MTGFNVELGRPTYGAPGNHTIPATVYLAGVELLHVTVPLSSGPSANQEAEDEALFRLGVKLKRLLEAS
jgi:hypothetical protein